MSDTKKLDQMLDRLEQPFAPRDLEWVPNFTYPKKDETYQNKVIAVAPYIRRESVVIRLNVICGKDGWKGRLEPMGKFGMINEIWVRCGDEWIPKPDGARQGSEGVGGPDEVKTGVSKSLRRAAEMWGIGLYLQFIPQLFAKKRPEGYYQSYGVWEPKDKSFKIRWDPPDLPKEYLPEHMTPEQYVRMKRIVRYFSEEKQKAVEDRIKEWEQDPANVTFEDAEMTIESVESRITKSLAAIDNRHIYPVENMGKTRKKSKKETSSPKQQPPKSSGQQASNPANDRISNNELQQLIRNIESYEEVDPGMIFIEPNKLEQIKKAVNDHHQGKQFINSEKFDELMSEITSGIELATDDDLPF